MTSTTDTRRRDRDDEEPRPQYVLLELVDGEVVVYDRTNHRAWVQSDAVVPLADAV